MAYTPEQQDAKIDENASKILVLEDDLEETITEMTTGFNTANDIVEE